MEKVAHFFTAAKPFIFNKTVWLIALALASSFGVVAPETATNIRDALSPISFDQSM